jgi:hypothetical protein
MHMTRTRIVTGVLWIGLMLALTVGRRPAGVQAADCFIGAWSCFQALAAAPASWFDTWLSSLDCEFATLNCERNAILMR